MGPNCSPRENFRKFTKDVSRSSICLPDTIGLTRPIPVCLLPVGKLTLPHKRQTWNRLVPLHYVETKAPTHRPTQSGGRAVIASPLSPTLSHSDILFLKHDSSILRQSPNPVCGFSMMEQVRLCAVCPTQNWRCSSVNHIQGWTTVWECFCHALEKGCLVWPMEELITW